MLTPSRQSATDLRDVLALRRGHRHPGLARALRRVLRVPRRPLRGGACGGGAAAAADRRRRGPDRAGPAGGRRAGRRGRRGSVAGVGRSRHPVVEGLPQRGARVHGGVRGARHRAAGARGASAPTRIARCGCRWRRSWPSTCACARRCAGRTAIRPGSSGRPPAILRSARAGGGVARPLARAAGRARRRRPGAHPRRRAAARGVPCPRDRRDGVRRPRRGLRRLPRCGTRALRPPRRRRSAASTSCSRRASRHAGAGRPRAPASPSASVRPASSRTARRPAAERADDPSVRALIARSASEEYDVDRAPAARAPCARRRRRGMPAP